MGKHKHFKVKGFWNFLLEVEIHAVPNTWKKWISIVWEKYGKTQIFRIYGFLKRARKSYYAQYSCVVIVLFNTALCWSAFSTVSFRKLVFLSFCAFFESRHSNLRHHAM